MLRITGLTLLGASLFACAPPEPETRPELVTYQPAAELQAVTLAPDIEAAVPPLLHAYLETTEADFLRARNRLRGLARASQQLLQSPDAATLSAARNAWLQANMTLEALLLPRYLGEQVFADSLTLELGRLYYRIKHWPVLPGYIDTVAGYGPGGLVHDITVPLSLPALGEQHGLFALDEAALGMHVLEFLLWGETIDGRPHRSASDFAAVTSLSPAQQADGISLAQLANNRRRTLLGLVVTALRDDFIASHELWRQGITQFRDRLNAFNGAAGIDLLMQAMITTLREELLVRSLFPLLNNNYRDSLQAPYSNSTNIAVVSLLGSMEQLLLNTPAPDGTSLDAVLVSLAPDFKQSFYENFDASKECLVLLYTDISKPVDPAARLAAEYEVVECINLLNNMIDHLQQVRHSLRSGSTEI